jgi:hypothetical protein
MPLVRCAAGCERLVSVSVNPRGNPVALADPGLFSADYLYCPRCERFWCDACAAASRCECGVEREGPSAAHALRIMFGGGAVGLEATVQVKR